MKAPRSKSSLGKPEGRGSLEGPIEVQRDCRKSLKIGEPIGAVSR